MAKQCYDSIADIGEYISYDPDTGIFQWKKRNGSFCKLGVPITSSERHGYLRVRFRRQGIKLHRLAFYLMTGEWPAYEVDHINGIVTDNRFVNLRLATPAENGFNRARLSATNTSGYMGVSWNKQKNKWSATIVANRKQIHLGYFLDKEDAAAAYQAARKIHHPTYVPR